MDKFKILLWNSNGINPDKIRYLQTVTRLTRANIIILIETHHKGIKFFFKDWLIYNFPSRTPRTKGFNILLHKNIKLVRITQINSRAINMVLEISKSPSVVLNSLIIYGHADHIDSKEWWEKLNIHQYDMVLGDFNVVLDPRRDRINYKSNLKTKTMNFLRTKLATFEDLAVTAEDLQMTYYCKSKPCSRLDRIYLKKTQMELFLGYQVIPNENFKDHQLILFHIGSTHRNPQKKYKSKKTRNELSKHLTESISRISPGETWTESKHRLSNSIKEGTTGILTSMKEKRVRFKKINKIPKNKPKYTKYVEKLNNLIEEITCVREALKNTGDWKNKDTASRPLSEFINAKKPMEKIRVIKNAQGVRLSKQKDIEDAFVAFYENLYSHYEIDKQQLINALKKYWDNRNLPDLSDIDKPIDAREVEDILKTRDNNSSPGEDLINYNILKNLDAPFLEQMNQTFNDVLANPHLIPEDWNLGKIITLFKGGDPLEIKNRRPITLLNADYKLMTKILTERVKKYLNQLIMENQVGFVPNRIGFDNIIILDQLIRDGHFILSIDIEKAFDSVAHLTIQTILEHLYFPPNFSGFITHILKNAKATISVNGKLTKEFSIKKGTRQGDPISPILFNLVIELLQRIALNCPFTDPPSINGVKTPILMFADDTAIITKSFKGMEYWFKVLNHFEKITGLKINKTKSSLLRNDKIPKNFTYIPQTDKIKYLGFWLDKGGIMENTSQTIESITNLAAKYYIKSNNIFKKSTIINTYILSKIWYQNYLLDFNPKDINKVVTRYLWTRGDWDGKMSTKVSLDRIFLRWDQGGLNIQDPQIKQECLRASLCFKLMNGSKCSKIWSKVLNTKFITNSILQRNNTKDYTNSPLITKLINSIKYVTPSTRSKVKEFIDKALNSEIPRSEYINNARESLKKKTLILTPRQLTWNHPAIKLNKLFTIMKAYPNRTLASFFWRYLQGALPFNHRAKCRFCDTATDTLSHLHIFFSCKIANIIQKEANIMLGNICGNNSSISYCEKVNNKWVKSVIKHDWNELSILKSISQDIVFSPKTAIYLTTLYTTWMIFSDPNTVPSAPRIDPTKLHRTTERTLNAFISSYKHKNQTKLKKAIETSWNCAHSFKKLAKCYKYRPGPTLQLLD